MWKVPLAILVIVASVAWLVYFYTHMSTLCHEFPWELDRKLCLPYNVSQLR